MKTLILAIAAVSIAHAQGRSQAEWMTAGADMQRSHSIPTDPKISAVNLTNASTEAGFQFLWKTKLSNDALGPAILMDRYIGYRGFRSFAFFASGAASFAAIDSDLNRVEWKQTLPVNTAAASQCGPMSAITRTTFPAFPSPIVPGRTAFARSDVGAEGTGAVTIPAALRAATVVLPPRGPDQKPRPALIYALAADGKLHSLYVSNGVEPDAPLDFLPVQASPQGLVVVNNAVAYASTSACNGKGGGVWSLDITTKQVTQWKPERGYLAGAGGPAFAPDGTIYVATTAGEIVALSPRTLDVKEVHSSTAQFSSSPVVFPHHSRSLIAVSASDGSIHLIDAANLAANGIKSAPAPDFAATALTSWETVGGVRWIVAASAHVIAAWHIVEHDGAFALERAWTSRELVSPSTPMIVNGVVFALSGGDRPTLFAFDGATGKQLWDSGVTLPSSVHSGSLSGGAGQIYLSTNDGTVYAFGYPMEH